MRSESSTRTSLISKVRSLSESSDEKSTGGFCSGASARLIVLVSLLTAVLLATVGGGYVFQRLETSHAHDVHLPSQCFTSARTSAKQHNWTAEQALHDAQVCTEKATKILTPSDGFLYSWSLYTTVGYGSSFPHTSIGRALSALFVLLFVPLFMAFKIEFGQISTLGVLRLGKIFQKILTKCRGKVYAAPGMPDHPSDGLLAVTLLFCIVVYMILTTLIVAFLEDMGYLTAFYLTFISVFLVGLGDIAPSTAFTTFLIILPLFLLGDAITSYLSYYAHGRCRIWVHQFARWATDQTVEPKIQLKDKRSTLQRSAVKRDRTSFPAITTTSMPMNIMTSSVNEGYDDSEFTDDHSADTTTIHTNTTQSSSDSRPVFS